MASVALNEDDGFAKTSVQCPTRPVEVHLMI